MSKAFVGLILTLPLAVSCFDDSELWEAIDQLEMRVDSLENNLNAQMQVVSDMLSGKKNMVISNCVMNADSSYVVTLSNGTSFTVLPQKATVASLVSVVLVDGKKCWAAYDQTGVLTPLYDAKGLAIPVDMAIDVKIVDGKYYLVAGGNEFMTGYDTEDLVQVFNSCEAHKDATGNVYAMTFDFGSGVKVTVTVDGYKGVLFMSPEDDDKVVAEYFVAYGESETFPMNTKGVVDYLMQIPEGWKVVEKENKLTGNIDVTVTAPSEELVSQGAAVAAGDLKVVSVVEGGKAAMTRLALSAEPFKTLNITSLKAMIEPYTGVYEYIYGLVPFAEYDKTQILENVGKMLTSSFEPEGYFESKSSLDKTHKEIYPGLQEGEAYMFWVVPVLTSGEDDIPAAMESMYKSYSLVPISLEMTVSEPTLLDATLKLKVVGAPQIYAGLAVMDDNVFDDILTQVNNGGLDMLDDHALFNYVGPASEFPDKEYPAYMEPNTSYVAWAIPVEEGKTEYLLSDITYMEFRTLDVKAGGSLKATVGNPVQDCSSISHTVTCENAAMIYYAYLTDEIGKYNLNFGFETKWDVIHDKNQTVKFDAVRGSSVQARVDELFPERTMWLYAVPVGHDGLCGEFVCQSATTAAVEFNKLTVSLTEVEILSDEATYKVAFSDTPTDYIFWVGRKSDEFWTRCNSSRLTAEKYLAANPDCKEVQEAMKKGMIESDGTLRLTGLTINKEHVLLVMAQDKTGNYSKAGYKSFATKSINLGTGYAPEGSEKWNNAKKFIEDNIRWDADSYKAAAGMGQGMATYAFEIKIPTDLTAYITCFSTKAAVNGGGLYDIMQEIEETCLARTTNNPVIKDPETGEDVMLPDWVDDTGRLIQGTMLNIYQPFPHGNPDEGQVTYFASGSHEVHCSAWDNGECSNYAYQVAVIEELTTLEYWVEHFKGSAGNWDTGDPNTSRVLKNEENLMKVAESYRAIHEKYYKGIEPKIYVNDGSALRVLNREASGVNESGEVVDVVTVMLKDRDNNYYDPIYIPVENHF